MSIVGWRSEVYLDGAWQVLKGSDVTRLQLCGESALNEVVLFHKPLVAIFLERKPSQLVVSSDYIANRS